MAPVKRKQKASTEKRKRKPSARRSPRQGITKLSVEGFKSLATHTEIEIRRLTVLAGSNSSGKSSILQPLLLLKQSLDLPYDGGPLHIAGPNVMFTSFTQFLSRFSTKEPRKNFQMGIEIGGNQSLQFTFGKSRNETSLVESMHYQDESESYELRPGMTSANIWKAIKGTDLESLLKSFPGVKKKKNSRLSIARNRWGLGIRAQLGLGENFPPVVLSPVGNFESVVGSIIHVPGLRANPARTYPTSAVGENFPGRFDDYVASVINGWKRSKSAKLKQLSSALKQLGLTWKIDIHAVDDTRVELKVGRLPITGKKVPRDLVSIADVGFGVSQALPVLVALITARSGQLVYLEQPETHLHPRAQGQLASLLVAAALRGVRVVLETHSMPLLLALRTLVAERVIAPRHLKLHWFARDSKTGLTSVKSAELDDIGAFGDWPEDFADTELELESRYLDAVQN